jgi:hypothetical protein
MLFGLCSSLYQRLWLLGHAQDLQNLLRYLELDSTGGVHFLLLLKLMSKNFCQDSGFSEGPESKDMIEENRFDGISDFAIPDLADSDRDSDLLDLNPSSAIAKRIAELAAERGLLIATFFSPTRSIQEQR